EVDAGESRSALTRVPPRHQVRLEDRERVALMREEEGGIDDVAPSAICGSASSAGPQPDEREGAEVRIAEAVPPREEGAFLLREGATRAGRIRRDDGGIPRQEQETQDGDNETAHGSSVRRAATQQSAGRSAAM